MICCYHTEAKGQMCKEIIPIFLCVSLLLSFTLPEIGDYTIRELICGVQDTITVVRGTRIVCEIIAVSNPGYVVYTIYDCGGIKKLQGVIHLRKVYYSPFMVSCKVLLGLALG